MNFLDIFALSPDNLYLVGVVTIISAIGFSYLKLSFLPSFGMNGPYKAMYSKMKKSERSVWDEKMLSSLHSLGVGGACFVIYLLHPEFYEDHDFYFKCVDILFVGGFSMGYFVYDFIFVILPNFVKYFPHVIHHIVTMTSIGYVLLCGVHQHGLIVFLCTEISTPFVNAIFQLRDLGLRETFLYKINGVLIILIWIAFRFVGAVFYFSYCIFLNWEALMNGDNFGKFWVIFQTVALAVLNTWWFYLIMKGFLKVILGKKGD